MNAKPHLLLCRESVILVECLRRKKDCLAWSYEQMTGLPTTVAVHCLNVRDQTPVKQPPRKYHPMVVDTIVREVDDQRGLAELQYATWLANLVPVKKKNGKKKICVDYRDPNKACPKDDFSLPNMDIITFKFL